ncbi:MAG TPA: hydantoinase/oxoprolinase family protein [Gemmatimonadaceae bacterium]|nr:hydantoinase/oxoprolinase family protein [Gemmatimonadaceae bacterium]
MSTTLEEAVSALSVGIDVGGTFTDLVSVDAEGAVQAVKVLSTPSDQADGVMRALSTHGAAQPAERIVHGTTVATNALLERTGARVALCITAGTEDLLELRRQDRAALYDLTRHHPPALVPRERCVGVPERREPQAIRRALSDASAREVADRVRQAAPEIVAVSLLHACGDATHEQLLARALRAALPGVDVVLSSDVLPEIREYERTATTVAEAYLRPRVARYMAHLAERLAENGYPPLAVMTSAGGMRTAADAMTSAASLALSGPAGGVVGAAAVARLVGIRDALTIDIGGTSADAGVIVDGEPLMDTGGMVARVPIALARVLVETVSAGGGSIGWVDDGGALRVGPASAGAEPGPAAFGRGGVDATVTDAHLVLGHVRQRRMSGGVALDPALAWQAVARLAAQCGAEVERTAQAMIAAADAAMARALRRVSVERGLDPRRATLVAFGGGGPLHGCALAEHLGMRAVYIPPHSGVLSAVGLALAPERRETLASVMRPTDALEHEDVRSICIALADRVAADGERKWWARVRYAGQGHELEVPVTPDDTGAAVAARFAWTHQRRFGYTLDLPSEIVGVRYATIGAARSVRLARHGVGWWTSEMEDTGALLDAEVPGPATIALPDATMLVRSGWIARAHPVGGWMVERTG